jgi:hypothetical protein
MSRSGRMNSKDYAYLAEARELINIEEAAGCYGCQLDHIQDLIARGMLHPLFDRQEVEELRQRHLHKQMNGRSSTRRERH